MIARKHKRRKNPVQSGLLIVPLFVLAITASPAKASSNLLENSPFLPAGAAVRATQQAAPLELRSILMEGGRYEFSLYDPVKKQSTWAAVNEPGHPFTIRAFDVAKGIVTVEQQNRTYPVALKQATLGLAELENGGTTAESESVQDDGTDAAAPSSPYPLDVQPLSTVQLNALDIFRAQEESERLRKARGSSPSPSRQNSPSGG